MLEHAWNRWARVVKSREERESQTWPVIPALEKQKWKDQGFKAKLGNIVQDYPELHEILSQKGVVEMKMTISSFLTETLFHQKLPSSSFAYTNSFSRSSLLVPSH